MPLPYDLNRKIRDYLKERHGLDALVAGNVISIGNREYRVAGVITQEKLDDVAKQAKAAQ